MYSDRKKKFKIKIKKKHLYKLLHSSLSSESKTRHSAHKSDNS